MILHYFQVCNIVIQHSYVPNKVITTINLITIYNHTKLLQYYWVYSSCHAAYYIPTTDLFYNWKFIPHSFLPSLLTPTSSSLTPMSFFSLYLSLFLFSFFLLFIDYTCNWNNTVFVSISGLKKEFSGKILKDV